MRTIRIIISVIPLVILCSCSQSIGNVNGRLDRLEQKCDSLLYANTALHTKVDSLSAANDSIRILYRDRINLVHEALSDFLDQFDSKLYYGEDPDFRWVASHAIKLLDTNELK